MNGGVVRVKGLDQLGALRRELRERERVAAEAAARAAAERAAREREARLFERSVGPVTRLVERGTVTPQRPRPLPLPLQRQADEARVLEESLSDEFDPATLMETDEELSFRRPWVGPDVLKRLRGGTWVIQGQIDLHGHRREEAREALAAFLADAMRRGWRCVRVVHGKGIGSPGRQPVLKGKVRSWLVQRQEVLAFTQARGPDGGAGALVVLIDPPPLRPQAV